MGHSLCSFILRQIPRRSPTHNAVYFTTTRLGGYNTFRRYFAQTQCDICNSILCVISCLRHSFPHECLPVTLFVQLADRTLIVTGILFTA